MQISKIFETCRDGSTPMNSIFVSERKRKNRHLYSLNIALNPSKEFQELKGFGCALTESAHTVLSKLPRQTAEAVITSCFDSDPAVSNCYTIARSHINSCDFSLNNWTCLPENSFTLDDFSMENPEQRLLPLLKSANEKSGKKLSLLLSPWSPPAWFKDNNDMNHGGKLLPQYRDLWADYILRYITELEKRGLKIDYLTIQNEPEAAQTWDSCCWSAEEEGLFAANFLGPLFEKNGVTTKILIWDHNRDRLFDRVTETMSVEGAKKYVAGAAYHWYSGDQYENVARTAAKFKNFELFFTEGCIEGGPCPGEWFVGERYAHNIINDLQNGCTAWIDWNMALDLQGGPNHVQNFCDAPILVDCAAGSVRYQNSYWYIGHFSRFIKKGARRIACCSKSSMIPSTEDGRRGNKIECIAFKNPDTSIVFVICNRTETEIDFSLSIDYTAPDFYSETGYNSSSTDETAEQLYCPPRSIQTLLLQTK
ncbi:MAG: glucosylceramidase [Treponema sp.]|jgi:glucosylceramidase|nr:glucosylceramidase [Treponema sp.]